MTKNDFFLIQFIRSHSHLFEVAILSILSSKNLFLASYIVVLKVFQFSRLPSTQYLERLFMQF